MRDGKVRVKKTDERWYVATQRFIRPEYIISCGERTAALAKRKLAVSVLRYKLHSAEVDLAELEAKTR